MSVFHFTKLRKHTEKIGSGVTPQGGEASYKSQGIPLIRSQNVRVNRLDLSDVALIDQDQHNKMSGTKVVPGDVLLNITGASIGRSCVVPDNVVESNVNQHVCIIRPKASLDARFLSLFLNSWFGQKQICSFQGGGSREALNFQQIGKFDIPTPPIPEQKAIADLLSTWDEAIEKTERLVKAKEKMYEIQLSKLFSKGNHERVILKTYLKEVSKRNRDLSITRVLSVTNTKGFVLPEEHFDRQVASKNLSNYKIVAKGEYAYNPSRINVGSIARLDDWAFGVLSPMYTVFKIEESTELDTDFFPHWLNSHEAKQKIKMCSQGSVRETVSFNDFCAIGFPQIDFKEQKMLAEYFSMILAEISSLISLADKYKTQKRGLMQKMLTGEWRLKPEVVKKYTEV